MSIRIDVRQAKVEAPTLQQNRASLTTGATPSPAVDLFAYSSYEHVNSVTWEDGSKFVVPQLSDAEQQSIASIYDGVSPEAAAQLRGAVTQFASDVWASAGSLGVTAEGQLVDGLADSAANAFQTYMLATGETDYELSVNAVMLASVEELQDRLEGFAGYVQNNLNNMADRRSDIANMDDALLHWPEGEEAQAFSWTEYLPDGTAVEHEDEMLTRKDADSLRERLDSELASMRDMHELDKFTLQDLYQRYNQAITTLSNVSKMEHDTLKAIIGNLRA